MIIARQLQHDKTSGSRLLPAEHGFTLTNTNRSASLRLRHCEELRLAIPEWEQCLTKNKYHRNQLVNSTRYASKEKGSQLQ
jgi:hypothetical protein